MSDNFTTSYVFELSVKGKQAVKEAQAYRDQINKALTSTATTAAQKTGTAGGAATNAGQLTQASQAAQHLAANMNSVGNATQKAAGFWKTFSRAAQESSREMWVFRRASYDIEKMGRGLMVAGLAAGAALYGMTTAYTTFDESATRAAMAMRLTSELSGVLRESIKTTAIETMKFSPDQIAEGLRLWAAGTGEVIRSEEQLNRMMGDTVEIQKLAAINNVEFSQTVDDVGGIMHEFGLQTKDVGRITSVLNFVAAESFANVNDLGQAFKMVGPLANELGVSFETTAAALAMMSDNNVKGTMAGRALRQVFLSLLDPTAKTTANLNKLFNVNESVGESWRDLIFPNDEFVGLAETFDILAASTENMTGSQRAELAAMLQNANAVPAFVTMLNNQNEARAYGINAMRAYEKVMTGVMDAEVVAYKRMYEETTKLPFSLEGAMAKMTNMWTEYAESDAARMLKLQQRWRVAAIDMGEPLTEFVIPHLEALMGWLEKIVKIVEANPDLLKFSVAGAAGTLALGVFLDSVGKFVNLYYLYKTFQPAAAAGFTAMAAATTSANVISGTIPGIAPAAAAAGMKISTGAAAAGVSDLTVTGVASLISMIGSGVALAALIAVVTSVIARIAYRKDREETAKTVGGYGPEVREQFKEMFTPTASGAAYVANDAAAAAVIQNLRKQGLIGGPLDMNIWESVVPAYAAMGKKTDFVSADDVDAIMQAIARGIRDIKDSASQMQLLQESSMSGGAAVPYLVPSISSPAADYTETQKAEAVAFYQHQESRRQMVADFAEKRKRIESDYSTWVVNAEANLTKSLGSLYADFTKDRARSAEDLEGGIAEATESAYKQSEDAAQNHYESLRNMQIAHAQRMVDLLEARDVQGITKEMRSYETQVDQQSRSYGQQQAKSAADLEDRIAKMKEDARKKDLQAEEDYNLKVAELRANFAEDMAERTAEKVAAQKELAAEQAESLQKLDDSFYEEIHGLEELLTTQYDVLLADLDTFTKNYVGKWKAAAEEVVSIVAMLEAGSYEASSRSGGAYLPAAAGSYAESSGGRAAGGYVNSGMYQMHNNEFVLSAETTRGLEGRYGHLSQQTFGDSMGQQTFVFSPTFNGMGMQDKSWFLKAANDIFNQNMSQLRGRVRA